MEKCYELWFFLLDPTGPSFCIIDTLMMWPDLNSERTCEFLSILARKKEPSASPIKASTEQLNGLPPALVIVMKTMYYVMKVMPTFTSWCRQLLRLQQLAILILSMISWCKCASRYSSRTRSYRSSLWHPEKDVVNLIMWFQSIWQFY